MKLSQEMISAMFKSVDLSRPKWHNRAVTLLGSKGVGKTTLLSQLPGMKLISTDYRGADLVSGCQVQRCFRWDYVPVQRKRESLEKFEKRAIREVANGNIGFLQLVEQLVKVPAGETILGIDTVAGLYNAMITDFCERNGIKSLPDDYGRTQSMLNRIFSDAFKTLLSHGYGIIWTAHIKEEKFATRVETISKVLPNVPKPVWDVISPASDVIFYFQLEDVRGKNGKRRTKRILTSELMEVYFDSGGRFEVEPFEVTSENYIKYISEAIDRKIGSSEEDALTNEDEGVELHGQN